MRDMKGSDYSQDTAGVAAALLSFYHNGGRWTELEKATAGAGRRVSSATISRTARGETVVTPDVWEALWRARPDIIPRPPWIHLANGMVRANGTANAGDSPVEPFDQNRSMRSVVVFSANCGEGGIMWTDGGCPVGESLDSDSIPSAWGGKNCFIVRLWNDSMEPKFSEGDKLLIDPDEEVFNGDIVFVSLADDGDKLVKRYARHGDTVILESFNRNYEPIILDKGNGKGVRIYKAVRNVSEL